MLIDNIYLPIGWNCDAALTLESLGAKQITYPFDWTINSYESIIKILEEEGKDFLLSGRYKIGSVEYVENYVKADHTLERKLKAIYESNYKMILVHDLYDGVTVEEIRDKYTRRIERLLEHLHSANKLRLVISEPKDAEYKKSMLKWSKRLGVDLPTKFNRDKFKHLKKLLNKKFPNLIITSVDVEDLKKK